MTPWHVSHHQPGISGLSGKCLLRADVFVESDVTLSVERNDVIRLHARTLLHSRRTNRHAGHGNAFYVGPLRNQSDYLISRYVAFDDISVDDSRVARLQLARDAVFQLYRGEVLMIVNLNGKSGGLNVINPLRAASAGRRFVDNDGWQTATD